MASKIETTKVDVRAARAKTKLNQSEFWNRIGVTQSGGSRYESGRTMPKPVRILFDITYGDKRASKKALKSIRPDLLEGEASA